MGGLDFGFRNPFAAVWGILDRDDVLWLIGEHHARQKPLSYHIERIPRDCIWYADPAGATENAELNGAGFKVRRGKNELRPASPPSAPAWKTAACACCKAAAPIS